MKNLINGILSTPMTPFDSNGRLNLEKINNFVSWQARNKIKGFYILGTWGGFPLLTNNERKLVTEAYSRACQKNNLVLMVHITTNSEKETIDLGKHALDNGVTAISSTLPGYYSSAGYLKIDDYKRYFEKIMSNVQSPLFLYNNPRTTGVLISPSEFTELVKIGLKGVKDGSKSLAWLLKSQNLLKSNNINAEIIPGNSLGLLYAFMYGCTAVTSGASVVYPKECSLIHDLLSQNKIKEAAIQHRLVLKLREAFNICSAAPSSAHFLLREKEYSLGSPRSLWPDLNLNQQEILKKKIDEIFLSHNTLIN